MGNQVSSPAKHAVGGNEGDNNNNNNNNEHNNNINDQYDNKNRFKSFPGSTILEKTFCGSIDTTDPAEYQQDRNLATRLLKRAEILCVSSPISSTNTEDNDNDNNSLRSFYSQSEIISPTTGKSSNSIINGGGGNKSVLSTTSRHNNNRPIINPSSAMFARALVSEVTDNPKTMKPSDMTMREKKLIKAQNAANRNIKDNNNNDGNKTSSSTNSRPVGTAGGSGPTNVLGSLAYACTGDESSANICMNEETQRHVTSNMPPNGGFFPLSNNINNNKTTTGTLQHVASPYQVTIGLSLSRKHNNVGHQDTVTRQTAFDFNELQDRQYKYVSSTDQYGWRAGGGEPGGIMQYSSTGSSDISDPGNTNNNSPGNNKQLSQQQSQQQQQQHEKLGSPDIVHIPIIHIDCPNAEAVDGVITALASGEIFIPHMSIIPEALSVSGISPPDLVVKFGCEHNDDIPPDEWDNWCLEFMHNQLYEYFYNYGARWMKRPFNIILAKSVRWKTVKHMNKYFSHAENIIDTWKIRGSQYLDPQLSYIDGGATPEEVTKPHGIYLFRGNGIPTNYFCPNFDPPYTTKMTRSLLLAVLNKSWDKKRREWTSEPIPRLVEPATLMAAALGCTDPTSGGFMAKEVTNNNNNVNNEDNNYVKNNNNNNQHSTNVLSGSTLTKNSPHNANNSNKFELPLSKNSQNQQQQQQQRGPVTLSEVEFGADDEDDDEEDDVGMNENKNNKSFEQRKIEYNNNKNNNNDNNDSSNNEDSSNQSEEKKSDEPIQSILGSFKNNANSTRAQRRYQTSSSANTSFITDDEGHVSVVASTYDASVAASGTTVLRTNTTNNNNKSSSSSSWNHINNVSIEDQQQNHQTGTNGSKLYCDEDWDNLTPRTGVSVTTDNVNTSIEKDISQLQINSPKISVSPTSRSQNRNNSQTRNSQPIQQQEQTKSQTAKSDSSIGFKDNDQDRYKAIEENNRHHVTTNISSTSSSTNDGSEENSGDIYNTNVIQTRKSPRAALQLEQQRQVDLLAQVRTVTESDNLKKQLQDTQTKMDRVRSNAGVKGYTMPNNFKVVKGGQDAVVEQTFSGTSLEYSTDGSSLFFATEGSAHSLLGQNLLQQGDGQSSIGPELSNTYSQGSDSLRRGVSKEISKGKKNNMPVGLSKTSSSSNDDNDSLLRDSGSGGPGGAVSLHGSSSNDSDSFLREDPHSRNQTQQLSKSPHRGTGKIAYPDKLGLNYITKEDTDSTANLSIQESGSYTTSTSIVPTDEELYAIGWAKALDPSSGNYYYFTLDRSKTVWENPLSNHDGNASEFDDNHSEVTSSETGAPISPKRLAGFQRQHIRRVDP